MQQLDRRELSPRSFPAGGAGRFIRLLAAVLAGAAAAAGLLAQEPPAPMKATHSIKLTDPSGTVDPREVPWGREPGFDVVELSIASDGKGIDIAATMNEEPGRWAGRAVELSFDTDNDRATGERGGFEYLAALFVCVHYEHKSQACAGAIRDTPVDHYVEVNLDRFKGKTAGVLDLESIIDVMGYNGGRPPADVPMKGRVAAARLDYADLKVRPGQTIRISATEFDSHRFLPDVLLTLK